MSEDREGPTFFFARSKATPRGPKRMADDPGGEPTNRYPQQGTPQGGVISALLARPTSQPRSISCHRLMAADTALRARAGLAADDQILADQEH